MKLKKVKLFPNNNQKSEDISILLKHKLEESGFTICDEGYELAIAIGGDGSFLRMLKQTGFNSDIYYIGINTGTLGFLQEIKPEELNDFINNLKSGNYKVEQIGIQKTMVETTESKSIFYSLNDIVIRDKDLNATIMDIKINDIELERFAGDGLLISTSVGSTAYNLSYGGTIVYNTLHTLQITPMAPFNTKAYRNLLNSIIIPEDKLIVLLPHENKRNIIVTVDGENNVYDNVLKIETIVSEKKINFIRMKDYDFINIINEKFLK